MTEREYLVITAEAMRRMITHRAGKQHFPWLEIDISVTMVFRGNKTSRLTINQTLGELVTHDRLSANDHGIYLSNISDGLNGIFGPDWSKVQIQELYTIERWDMGCDGGFKDEQTPTKRLVALNTALLSAGLGALNLHRTYDDP